ncbi:MAG: hypothetical protein OMM_01103 [Candidatus Magnetoglobus multicellularis str. Araruama]|uniref:Lipoprotein n=1 Tax=Candidatus Magnetoglobus multicellularis str. Araruama TaxID=890399 RepID=A0A1V1PEK3_9BACT|nr:MAG: hypothetical protein OMM_01103 [Candidatus Magnetoglobus multicellularis str. Araruama]
MHKPICCRFFGCLIILIALTFSACSDMEYEAEKHDIVYQGKFIYGYNLEKDIVQTVNGLRYNTETQSGVTESGGKFNYKKNEDITFYIGNVKMGDKVPAQDVMSPVDLVPNTIDIENQKVTNISRLLQSVGTVTDEAIYIPSQVVSVIESETVDNDNEINFDVSSEQFVSDTKEIFNTLQNTTGESYTLVSAKEAQDNLKKALVESEQESGFESYTNTISTHFQYYPLAAYFDRPEKVYVNGERVNSDITGGFRKTITLKANQANAFAVTAMRYGNIIGEKQFHITHAPVEYTPGHQILYSFSVDHSVAETFVIDIDAKKEDGTNGVIIGYMKDINIVACSNDNQFLVDDTGQVYLSSTHQPVGEPLPFSQTGESHFYPLFSPDDHYCYAGTIKIDFAVWKAIFVDNQLVSGKWVYNYFPVYVDSRYATITDDERYLFQTNDPIKQKIDPLSPSKNVYEVSIKVDLFTDEIVDTIDIQELELVKRETLGDMLVSPDGSRGFLTTHADHYGSMDVIDLINKEVIKNIDGLSAYPGNTIFINNNSQILFGCAGSSWYGGGNVYIAEFDGEMVTLMNQFNVSILQYGHEDCVSYGKSCGQYGAYAVAQDRAGFLYITSRYIKELGNQKEINNCSPDRRGIDQLRIEDGGHFTYIQTFFFNASDSKTMHFIKGK